MAIALKTRRAGLAALRKKFRIDSLVTLHPIRGRFPLRRGLAAGQPLKPAVGRDLKRAVRYLLVGALAWLIDVAVFGLCVSGAGVAPAQLCARVSGAVVAFFGHKVFVFCEADFQPAAIATQAVRYAALWLLSVVISTLALIGLIEHAGASPLSAKIAVETGVVAINYLVMKRLVFQPVRAKKA